MWVICMFRPADAHIVVCDLQRLRGPEARICMADCASVIIKALKKDDNYDLLLQARLRDDAKAANPGV